MICSSWILYNLLLLRCTSLSLEQIVCTFFSKGLLLAWDGRMDHQMPLGLAPALLVLALEVEPRLAAFQFQEKMPKMPNRVWLRPTWSTWTYHKFAICLVALRSKEMLRLTQVQRQTSSPASRPMLTQGGRRVTWPRKVEIFTGHHLCTKHRRTMSLLMFFLNDSYLYVFMMAQCVLHPVFLMVLSWR